MQVINKINVTYLLFMFYLKVHTFFYTLPETISKEINEIIPHFIFFCHSSGDEEKSYCFYKFTRLAYTESGLKKLSERTGQIYTIFLLHSVPPLFPVLHLIRT